MTATTRTALVLCILVGGIVVLGIVLLDVADPGDGPGAGPEGADERDRRGGSAGASLADAAALTGAVRFAREDRPAAGITVRLSPAAGPPLVTETNALGRFRLEDLEPEVLHELTVEARGAATIRLPGIALDPGETRDVGTLDLAPGVRAVVAVQDLSGRALAGAVVEAFVVPRWWNVDWSRRIAQLAVAPVAVTSAVTDEEGRVRLEGLAMGRWTFRAVKTGYAGGGKARVELRADLEDEVVIRLRPGYPLAGRVTDREGSPLAGATVQAIAPGRFYSLEHWPLHGRTVADEEGRYGFDALVSGDHVLYVGLDAWAAIPAAAVRLPGVSRIDLVVDVGGTLMGRVLARETRKPVSGARIRLGASTALGPVSGEAVADDEGRYAFPRLPCRRISGMRVEAEGWYQASATAGSMLHVPPGETVVQDFEMTPGARLSGRVTTEDGPVEEAIVQIWFMGDRGWPSRRSTRTDAGGAYEVSTLPGGPAFVQIRKDDCFQPDAPEDWGRAIREGRAPARYRVDVPREGEATLDVEVSRGIPVEGRVEGADGEPVAGARVSLNRQGTSSSADGSFRIEVPPGTDLRIFAHKDGALMRDPVTVDVRPGEPVRDLVLVLGAALRITGTLSSASGEPLRDARVTLHRGGYRPRAFNINWTRASSYPVTDDGAYEALGWATSGNFVVRGEALGHAPAMSDPVEIVPGQEVYEVDLILSAGVELTGRVTADGVAVPGATVGVDFMPAFRGRPGWPQQDQQFPTLAVTGGDGRFRVPHLAPGSSGLIVRAVGCMEKRLRTEVPAPGDLVIDLERMVEIRGLVVDPAGRPVAGVQLRTQAVTEDGPNTGQGGTAASATTSADGRFVLTGLTGRRYRVIARAPWTGEGPNVRATQTDPVMAGGESLRIVVEPGEAIGGRVLDDDGRSLVGVLVQSRHEGGTTVSANRSAMTDRDGAFRLKGLESGSHTVGFSLRRGPTVTHQSVTRTGIPSGTEGLEIVLPRTLEIAGHVEDEASGSLKGRRIEVHRLPDPGGKGRPARVLATAVVDEDGSFRIGGLEAGRYRLRLAVRGGSAGLLHGGEEVEAGRTDLRLIVSQGLTIGGVVQAEGRPLASAHAWATEKGQSTTAGQARCDASGRFVLRGLREGVRYVIRVQAEGYRRAERDGVLAGTTDLVIRLEAGLRVSGRLVDAAGKPVRGFIYFIQGKETAWGRTNERGEFSVSGLLEGTSRVSVQIPGRRGGVVEVGTVQAGSSGVELRLPE